MSDTPAYRTLHHAVTIIRENWPGASDWREIRELEGLLPDDPLAMETPLPEAARNSVRQLLERLPIEGGTPPPPPRGGALKACRCPTSRRRFAIVWSAGCPGSPSILPQ